MKERKAKAIATLGKMLPKYAGQLRECDSRLLDYFEGVSKNSELHNIFEILGAVKFLRLMGTYDFDADFVKTIIKIREGEWVNAVGRWQHKGGGLLVPSSPAPQVFRWMPFQVFVLASIFGFKAVFDTGVANGTRPLLESEIEGANGQIWDVRRLCTEFIFFAPRKTDKTGLSAYINFIFFMLGDVDAEIYCCANAKSQSKIVYERTRGLIRQLDDGQRIRYTESVTQWKSGQMRQASLCALSAGGKTKDGLNAQVCCVDEYGSAGYTKGKSDMGALVNVVASSMGRRREPLTFISTTAGTITSGPFVEILENTKRGLLSEDGLPKKTPTLDNFADRKMCLLLTPDEWEISDEFLLKDKNVRRKVNPSLGVIVNESFYDEACSSARQDSTTLREVTAKLFNVYGGSATSEWAVTPLHIQRLQADMTVKDCTSDNGWAVFVGLDFSSIFDLFAVTYFCVNYSSGIPMEERFFADGHAWICRKALNESPNRVFFDEMIKDGHLSVGGDDSLNHEGIITEIVGMETNGVKFVRFGYDAAQSFQPINTLRAWLAAKGYSAEDTNKLIVPVSQTAMSMNPLVSEAEHYILTPWVRFSRSPMWPWQFGNASILSNADGTLRRVVKKRPDAKIDNIHALLDAIRVFDLTEAGE